MVMHTARSIDKVLTKKWATMAADGLDDLEEKKGVQILLLDGEEAFKVWTQTDSLYGSRYVSFFFARHAELLTSFPVLSLKNGKPPSTPPHPSTRHRSTQ